MTPQPAGAQHAFDFQVDDTQCTARYTYNNSTSVSVTISTDTLMRLFQR